MNVGRVVVVLGGRRVGLGAKYGVDVSGTPTVIHGLGRAGTVGGGGGGGGTPGVAGEGQHTLGAVPSNPHKDLRRRLKSRKAINAGQLWI